jgi:hypothetical protein
MDTLKHGNLQDEAALRGELEQSRGQLDALAGELRAIDAELVEVEIERQQVSLLGDVCGALEKLDEQQAAALFWDGIATVRAGQTHVAVVRTRVDEFQQRLGAIEAARQGVLTRIAGEEDNGELIADDLYELERLEEERKREWIVEREQSCEPDRPAVMPWTRGGEEDRRLRRSLAVALLLSLLVGVVFPWIPLPMLDRWAVIEVPERLTRLIEERATPPPAQEMLPERAKPEEFEQTPLLAEEGTPEPTTTKEEPKPGAGAKGILAFRSKFSSLADSAAPAKLGSQARITRDGELASGRPSRSLVATNGPGSSGGIDISALSRNVGGGGGEGMAGVQVAQATSSIGAVGGGNDRPLSGGPGSSRTDEEIQIVFDRHKAALYRLYNRALRRNPTLQGQIVLRMTIEPDGSVSLCELQSSDMRAPELAQQVVGRVKTFDFGAKDAIPAITIVYPIDFLPAT